MEKFRYWQEKLKPESDKEQFEIIRPVEQNYLRAQLEYARSRCELSGQSVSDFCEKETAIFSFIDTNFTFNEKLREHEVVREKLVNTTRRIIDSVPLSLSPVVWSNQIVELLNQAYQKIDKEIYVKLKDEDLSEDQEAYDGEVLKVNFAKIENAEEAESYGLAKGSVVLEIHVEPKQSGSSSSFQRCFRTELQQLADKISHLKDNQNLYITACSWLVSTSLAPRLGFSVTRQVFSGTGPSNPHINPGYWWQIMNEKGQINEKQLQLLNETGHLQYPLGYGKMKAMDFINKFSGVNKKGE